MKRPALGIAAAAAIMSLGGVARATGSTTALRPAYVQTTYVDGLGRRKLKKVQPRHNAKRAGLLAKAYFDKLAKQRTDAAEFGGDHRHDKYLHSHARRMRHMKLALAGKTLPKELTA